MNICRSILHAPFDDLYAKVFRVKFCVDEARSSGWTLRFRTVGEEGSPPQAWFFYIALVLFPLWWVGAFWRVLKTRVVEGTDTEKAMPLDDPQIDFGMCVFFDFLAV